SLEVTILIVLSEGSSKEDYRSALNSMEAYSALHGYRLRIESDRKYEECEKHGDKFFRRHCHTYQMMLNELPEESWILFVDADVGVVNPNKLIEDFIEEEYDIYLYNRFYNWEFAAQYLFKNNERGRDWIKKWADMEFSLPNSFHGTDNGALHILMMHYLVPTSITGESSIGEMCQIIWEQSKNYDDVFTMQACTRMMIGERDDFPEHHVKIFPKGKGWARDAWLLNSRWSMDDFMLHSIKETNSRTENPEDPKNIYNFMVPETDRSTDPLAFPVLNITQFEVNTQQWTMDGRLLINNSLRSYIFRRLTIEKWQQQVK
ncbi:hypothetical protein PMAYCL1PPCAC_32998, partial [Pristionchus mayeri]